MQQGDEWHHWITDIEGRLLVQDSEGFYRIASDQQFSEWQSNKAKAVTRSAEIESHVKKFPNAGTPKGLLILVEFPDKQFADSINQIEYYRDFMMKERFNDLNSYGSVHDYFYENSMGTFDPQFDIYGPVMMSQSISYYGKNNSFGNDQRAYETVTEACQLLETEIDFAQYDNDDDGFIDLVSVIYVGEGENNGSSGTDLIWPHSSIVPTSKTVVVDGKTVSRYMCTNELYQGLKDGIGTFCHEFLHALGLPDTYNTQSGNYINGSFDIMETGLYLGSSLGSNRKEGRCPSALTAYERFELGWLMPDSLVGNKQDPVITSHKDTIQTGSHLYTIVTVYDTTYVISPDTLPCLTTTNKALLLPVKSNTKDVRDGEYYIFENRQQTGWDSYLPGHGLLAWHIDYDKTIWNNNIVNNSIDHPCVELIKADNKLPSAGTAASDPFPGTKNNTEFSAASSPALLGWDIKGSGSGKSQPINNAALTDIKEEYVEERSTTEMTIMFSFTDDGPKHYLGIEEIQEEYSQESAFPNFYQTKRVWQDGKLLIITPTGIYDQYGLQIK